MMHERRRTEPDGPRARMWSRPRRWSYRHRFTIVRQALAALLFAGGGAFIGQALLFTPIHAGISIKRVSVTPLASADGTRLEIRTRYRNQGCDQVLLARFLINSAPSPSIALPQQQGPTILPPGRGELTEEISLDTELGAGIWHLFNVATCYREGEPVPRTDVAPTALFQISGLYDWPPWTMVAYRHFG